MQFSALRQRARAGTEIDGALVQMLAPGMGMPVGEHEEQALDLDASASTQQGHQAPGAQGRQALKDHVQIVEGRVRWQCVERFEDGALGGRNLERPAPGAHRRAVSRPRRALELMLGILDAGKVVTEQDARANEEPCLARKAGQPGGNFAIEIDRLPAAKRQIVGEPMEAERAQTAQMNVMPHDPLDGEQRELPVGLCSDKRAPGLIAMRQRAAVDPAHHPLQPAPLGIVVDGLGIDPEALQPERI